MLDLKAVIDLASREGLWLATGFNVGIGTGGGSGEFLAKWITSGSAPRLNICPMQRQYCHLCHGQFNSYSCWRRSG